MAAPTQDRSTDNEIAKNEMSAFKPSQEGITMPQPPTFATSAEERLHRKQQLAGAFRLRA